MTWYIKLFVLSAYIHCVLKSSELTRGSGDSFPFKVYTFYLSVKLYLKAEKKDI